MPKAIMFNDTSINRNDLKRNKLGECSQPKFLVLGDLTMASCRKAGHINPRDLRAKDVYERLEGKFWCLERLKKSADNRKHTFKKPSKHSDRAKLDQNHQL